MGTTKETIAAWFDDGVRMGARWMVVACDTWDWEDHPIYVKSTEDVHAVVSRLSAPSEMWSVMEVYSFERDKQAQLDADRAWNLD